MYLCGGKRLFDLFITLPALVVQSPLLTILSLLAQVKLGSPIYFVRHAPA
jgi:lipopolysaccharide/colanic/teichoic acid biosynthesis glycosyltransferase